LSGRNYAAHTAARVVQITLIAGYEVQVDMHDSLARHFAHVDANVITGRGIFSVEIFFALSSIVNSAALSSSVVRKKSATCRLGMIRRWPGLTGNLSGFA
jgi:F0F1-type ATP synthase beta subunit